MKHGIMHGKLPPRTTAPIERSAIVGALSRNHGNVSEAARDLGSARRTLQKRMRDYGIPEGRSGRPRSALPYRAGASAGKLFIAVGAIVGGYYLGKLLVKKYKEHAAEQEQKQKTPAK